MRPVWKFTVRFFALGSFVVLVVLGLFLNVAEPSQGQPGILFVRTPWGVGRVYVEQTLHVCWLHPWAGVAGERRWGVRCGWINMSDGAQDGLIVGTREVHWIGPVEVNSGQIAVGGVWTFFTPRSTSTVAISTPAQWDKPILLRGLVGAGGATGTAIGGSAKGGNLMGMWMAFVPWWVVFGGLSVLPGVWVGRKVWRERGRREAAAGVCVVCGYDLRATPGRCPECGSVVGKFEDRNSNDESNSKSEIRNPKSEPNHKSE